MRGNNGERIAGAGRERSLVVETELVIAGIGVQVSGVANDGGAGVDPLVGARAIALQEQSWWWAPWCSAEVAKGGWL